jgi:hypothetical protein
VTWKGQLSKGTLELGWQDAKCAFHISKKGLHQGAPASFQWSVKKDNPDQRIWIDSYLEEPGGRKEQNTCSVLTSKKYATSYGNIQIIPSMCVQSRQSNPMKMVIPSKQRAKLWLSATTKNVCGPRAMNLLQSSVARVPM